MTFGARIRRRSVTGCAGFLLACVFAGSLSSGACAPGGALSGGAQEPASPAADEASPEPPQPRELTEPPPPGVSPEASFPAISEHSLDSGLALKIVERHTYPIVELRLVLGSGQASDGDKTGLALLAGELLKAGGAGPYSSRELLERAEALGTSLSVTTDRDSTTISLYVTTHDVPKALELLSVMVKAPRFSQAEFDKLKQREIERVSSLARTSGGWSAAMLLYRELYHSPAGRHPYSSYDATPAELQKVQLWDCRRWYQEHVTPKNAFLVAAGDVTPESLKELAQKAFSGWRGEAPERPRFSHPAPSEQRPVYLVDRPGSSQSDVFVATLGPQRDSPHWAELRVINQVLGGGVAGRLFLDVREQRSLAYSTGSQLREVAHGPVILSLYAGTQTAKTGHAVQALLEHFEKIRQTPPSETELQVASRYLADSFLMEMETVGSIARLTAQLFVMNLPNDHYDSYRRRVRELTPAELRPLAERVFQANGKTIVVAGDASRIAAPLRRFGDVHVIDPAKSFVTQKRWPADPKASLDLRDELDPQDKKAPSGKSGR